MQLTGRGPHRLQWGQDWVSCALNGAPCWLPGFALGPTRLRKVPALWGPTPQNTQQAEHRPLVVVRWLFVAGGGLLCISEKNKKTKALILQLRRLCSPAVCWKLSRQLQRIYKDLPVGPPYPGHFFLHLCFFLFLTCTFPLSLLPASPFSIFLAWPVCCYSPAYCFQRL